MVNGNQDSLLIVGSGAMACLFAARLSASEIPVTMLGNWMAGIEALQQHGVTLVERDGSQKNFQVRAVRDPDVCRGVNQALVLVKSWQTQRAANQLSACLSPKGVALTLQNGLGNRETLEDALGKDRVALGSVTTGAHLLAPGIVQMAGEGVVTLGDHPLLGVLKALMQNAGFIVESASDIDSLMWGKLAINAAINPLTALLEIPNGKLLEKPHARDIMKAAALETAAVANAQGISIPFSNIVDTVTMVARRTSDNRSSMLQDIQRGAPTEIDAICGAITSAGEKMGVDTPVNRLLWQLIKAKVEK
jgi:2-dehydropantoate 2-reductase